jgi:hypothetical protein
MPVRTRVLRPVRSPDESDIVLDLSFPDLNRLDGRLGQLTLLCPSCGSSLAVNMLEGQLGQVVLRCPCGTYCATA